MAITAAFAGIDLQSPELPILVSIFATAVAVVGFFAEEIRDRRGRRAKAPRWTAWNLRGWLFFGSNVDYEEPPQHPWLLQLTVTRLAFWNAGFNTIHSSNVSVTAPFRIVGRDETKLIEVKLIRTNSTGGQFRVSADTNGSWLIQFSYLRPGTGGLFSVTHSGDIASDVGVMGEVVEGHELQHVSFPSIGMPYLVPKQVRRVIGDRWAHRLAVIIFLLTLFVVAQAAYTDLISARSPGLMGFVEAALFVGVVIGQILVVTLFLRGFRETVPPGLRPFDVSNSS